MKCWNLLQLKNSSILGCWPLVFLFGAPANASDLQQLRSRTKASMGVYPYIVSMNQQALAEVDAVSKYVTTGGSPNGAPYAKAIQGPEAKQWDAWATAGKKVIPTVSAGTSNDRLERFLLPLPHNYCDLSMLSGIQKIAPSEISSGCVSDQLDK